MKHIQSTNLEPRDNNLGLNVNQTTEVLRQNSPGEPSPTKRVLGRRWPLNSLDVMDFPHPELDEEFQISQQSVPNISGGLCQDQGAPLAPRAKAGLVGSCLSGVALVIVLLLILSATPHGLAQTAGVFRWPFAPNETWSACKSVGWKRDQYHGEWNAGFRKNHAGEDWNGKCGASTDKGAALYSIAAGGRVMAVDQINSRDSIGKSILIRYRLPDLREIGLVIYHCEDILVRSGETPGTTRPIATVGDANGFYPRMAHAHIETRLDLNMPLRANPYRNPLTIRTALKYTSPSVFIDDRRWLHAVNLRGGEWTFFSVPNHAPGATAYLEHGGEKFSLKRSSDLGLIYPKIHVYDNGGWHFYEDIRKVFFRPNLDYAIYSFRTPASLNILIPQNNFKPDRARLDCLHSVKQDRRFSQLIPSTYAENLDWDTDWELRSLNFLLTTGEEVTVFQTTRKSNPLERYTTYQDPQTQQWTAWKWVDWNEFH